MSSDITPIRSTGIGSWPGTSMPEALKATFGECPELPYLPELPDRGPHAQMIGRATALLPGLHVDLQPAGWRLTDGSGRDHRLAKSTMRSDLDELEEVAQGYVGAFKFAVTGPWTLAALMERPRGDKVLADHGARRDLAQSLSEGVADLLHEMRRRLPDLVPLLQLDEPLLPAVVSGRVATASGFSTHRIVSEKAVIDTYAHLVDRVAASGSDAPVVVHCCAAGLPMKLLRDAGVHGFYVDLDQLTTADWDVIGLGLEEGLLLGAGALPTTDGAPLGPDEVASRVLRPVRALGIDPMLASTMVITPACGLAGLDQAGAVRALRTVRTAAGIVTDQLAD